MKKIVLHLTLTSLFIASCFANELVVTTTPEKAEIKVSLLQGVSEKVKIGESPFKMSLKEISNNYLNDSELFILEIIKEGHEPYRVVVPTFLKSTMSLDLVLQPKSEWDETKKTDKLVNELFEVQRLIRAQNYSTAASKIEELEKKHPRLSIIKELKASGYYLQSDYKKALDFYKQAYFANSENIDAYKMMVYLEKSLGVTKPNGDQK